MARQSEGFRCASARTSFLKCSAGLSNCRPTACRCAWAFGQCRAQVAIYPTPYCGYYGAMRDRIPLAARDPLDAPEGAMLVAQSGRAGYGERWRITPPHNLAVIRSANTWGRMDEEQLADYERNLQQPLQDGMAYLRESPLPTGCASLRMQRKFDAQGRPLPEEHALGHFLSLRHMEAWAENHATHAAIFKAATSRYKALWRGQPAAYLA
ncbi:phenylacetaldoxime dehydratase family protein [Variovorax sp. LjRoot175]|uniref:phenylacetaldoxime dehydratase family protein n=1 Tax=Variovorax sp. LjRoot175 TaxID=3342276 RepID=UPI003ECE60DB